ncbi:MAG: hypothetical protein IKN63_03465 [Bacilli bacterium]|nr:hypothetical protein [Bacilli bacterium]
MYFYKKKLNNNIIYLEKEIKYLKKKINQKINFTRHEDKKQLIILEDLLSNYYQLFYILDNNKQH